MFRLYFSIILIICQISLAGGHLTTESGHSPENNKDKKHIVILVGRGHAVRFIKAVKELKKEKPVNSQVEFQIFYAEELDKITDLSTCLKKADLILFDGIFKEISNKLKHTDPAKAICYDFRARINTQRHCRQDKMVKTYFRLPVKGNIINLCKYVLKKELGLNVQFKPPIEIPPVGIFHPDSNRIFVKYKKFLEWYKETGHYKENTPWVGVTEYNSRILPGDFDKVAECLIRYLEKWNMNVLPVYGFPAKKAVSAFFFTENGSSRVNIILPLSFGIGTSSDKDRVNLEKLGCPVLNPIRMFGLISEWEKSSKGLNSKDFFRYICLAEGNGLIEPAVIGGRKEIFNSKGWAVGAEYAPIRDHLELLLKRTESWLKLQKKPNKNKKVVIMYYSHPGKNIGASYLDAFASLVHILKRLQDEGYKLDEKLPSLKELKKSIIKNGINIGDYAPGELDKLISQSPDIVKINFTDYFKWYKKLPKDFRENVEKSWGKPDQFRIMVKNGSFYIPCLKFGNIILMPQPARGWSSDPDKLYHSDSLYPHHQYIAAYFWLHTIFNADAIVYLGRHGTHEWLPGKQAGLSMNCPPEIHAGKTPIIYPYIVDGIGEGMNAKRRAKAVIISHLTPSISKAGLYEEYSELASLINEYDLTKDTDTNIADLKLKKIINIVHKTTIQKHLENSENFNDKITCDFLKKKHLVHEYLEKISDYLDKLKNANIPYGLHVFGLPPTGKSLDDFSKIISQKNPEASLKNIKKNLQYTTKEMDNLIRALNGIYIKTTHGYDPIRDPSVLPTGRNFYGIDPRRIPSEEAFKVGSRQAEEMISMYKKKNNGAYPEKIGLIIWSGETRRTEGTQIATALYLMGMRPKWDKNGRISGVIPIPGGILKRPRIDVHIQVSGLFRDAFPNMIVFLDDAVRKATELNDIENLIAQNSKKLADRLKKAGVTTEKAEILSKQRIFSAQKGDYGTRLSNLAGNSGIWKDDKELAEAYIENVSYGYGRYIWGEKIIPVYKDSLKGVDMTMHTRSSNLYQILDNDDVFQYLGGLTSAIRYVKGRNPYVVISHQEDPNKPFLDDLAETLNFELTSRNFNPKWLKGMMKNNYAGAREITDQIENFWGWQTTVPNATNEEQWARINEIYVKDKYQLNLKKFFNNNNPWAYQMLTARMLEAVRKNYWHPQDKVTKDLCSDYATNITQHGTACCDFICDNPQMNKMVLSLLRDSNGLPPDTIDKFKEIIENVSGKKLNLQIAARERFQNKIIMRAKKQTALSKLNNITITAQNSRNSRAKQKRKKIKGFKFKNIVKQHKRGKTNPNARKWIVSLISLILTICFYIGLKMKDHSTNGRI